MVAERGSNVQDIYFDSVNSFTKTGKTSFLCAEKTILKNSMEKENNPKLLLLKPCAIL
jgi:hypothetical protein